MEVSSEGHHIHGALHVALLGHSLEALLRGNLGALLRGSLGALLRGSLGSRLDRSREELDGNAIS